MFASRRARRFLFTAFSSSYATADKSVRSGCLCIGSKQSEQDKKVIAIERLHSTKVLQREMVHTSVHTAKVYIYANICVGEPKLTDFELKTEVLDAIKDGEFIAEAMYFGINAGLRAYIDLYPIGSIIVGGQIAK